MSQKWQTPIWPKGVRIPVIGVTGPYASGKTLFMLTMAPGLHPEGHQFTGQPRTRLYDFELSAASYDGLATDRVASQEELRKKHPSGDYKPIDVFRWWLNDVRQIKPGQFDVIAVDTAGDIESGLSDFVRDTKYGDYGFKSPEAFESMGGVFWKYVKEFWKQVLSDLAVRCQTFAFSAHLQKVWVNGKPTSREKPAGKSTLMELSSLYLWLERKPDGEGRVPAKPVCREMLKNRVTYTGFDPATYDAVIKPYLPPAFVDATPAKIREYINRPADYGQLKPEERVKEQSLSEDEKLLIQQEIAQSKAQAEQTALELLNRKAELQRTSQQAREMKATQESAAAAVAPAPSPSQPPAQPTAPAAGDARTQHPEVAELLQLKAELGMPDETFTAGLRRVSGTDNVYVIPIEQVRKLVVGFRDLVAKKKQAGQTAA